MVTKFSNNQQSKSLHFIEQTVLLTHVYFQKTYIKSLLRPKMLSLCYKSTRQLQKAPKQSGMRNVYDLSHTECQIMYSQKKTSSFYIQGYTHDRNLSGGGLMLQMNGKIPFQSLTDHLNDSNLEMIAQELCQGKC